MRIKPSEITPESVYLRRRELIRAALGSTALLLTGCGQAAEKLEDIPGKPLGKLPSSGTKETLTTYKDATHYNNFYEFGTNKNDPANTAGAFVTRPWKLTIAGHAEETGTFDLDEILARHPLEERIYRMRCVEGWSMVLPWAGFPLASLIERAKPTSKAKYVAFTSLLAPERMPGQRYDVLDWPYREGLRIDEAMHPLTLMVTGLYGHELPNQNGAPLRLVVPWKYGFKGIKAITKIEFVENEPSTSWNVSDKSEYGFYSNVNPAVDHPRWSQKTERRISGSSNSIFADRIPTLPFNGYAEQVASLYAGMDLKKFF